MLRRALALFFVFIWIAASGYDLLEDYDLSVKPKVKTSQKATLPGIGYFAQLANDNLENSNQSSIFKTQPFKLPPPVFLASCSFNIHKVFTKHLRIYKFQRVFLI
jgi:hypothetical protein